MPNDSYQFQFQEIIRAEVGDSSNETLIMIVRISISQNSLSVLGSSPITMVSQIPARSVNGHPKPVHGREWTLSPIIKIHFNLCFDKNIIFRDGYRTGYARCSINPCVRP